MVRKVTIEVSDEQLVELGNAIAAYGDILWNINLDLEVPDKFRILKVLPKSELKHRLGLLKQLFNDLSK